LICAIFVFAENILCLFIRLYQAKASTR